ncbi:uncharacterized protein F4807DRAFT_129183 [Annulohypoxylon truncatum]|uniref:uncharacterized protein n=1 Tax=Annulohypoxylon truncatum TaxID=327061 RepID=UPI002007E91D|nr:uncharacterized protein F4807DRAFT_129183 [Annulohypoxylon truncatum]KAI1214465.1 hypothetical protein F4807DRAFT_129183 [Annulohypoxylon truncatum]
MHEMRGRRAPFPIPEMLCCVHRYICMRVASCTDGCAIRCDAMRCVVWWLVVVLVMIVSSDSFGRLPNQASILKPLRPMTGRHQVHWRRVPDVRGTKKLARACVVLCRYLPPTGTYCLATAPRTKQSSTLSAADAGALAAGPSSGHRALVSVPRRKALAASGIFNVVLFWNNQPARQPAELGEGCAPHPYKPEYRDASQRRETVVGFCSDRLSPRKSRAPWDFTIQIRNFPLPRYLTT